MTRVLLILVQLAVLALPAGVCTCARTDWAATQTPSECACCCDHSCRECAGEKSSSPSPARNQPCREPSCPAHPSIAKIVTCVPTQPTPALPPMTVIGTVVEPSASTSQFADQRQNDAILLPTAYLFLIYGTLLI